MSEKTKGQKISEKQKLTWKNPEVKKKRIEGMKRSWKDNHNDRVESLKVGWINHYEDRCTAMKKAMSTPEMKKKRSEQAKEIWSRPGYREKMIPLLREYYIKSLEDPKNRITSRCARTNRTGKSYIEKLMVKILDSAEVEYYQQYPITYRKGSGYVKFVDFLVPNLKRVIECDGEMWHQDKAKDDERDKIILSVLGEDWTIQHVPGKEIYEISKFLGFI